MFPKGSSPRGTDTAMHGISQARPAQGRAAGAGDEPHRGAHPYVGERGIHDVKTTPEPPGSRHLSQHLAPIARPPVPVIDTGPASVPPGRQANSPKANPSRQHPAPALPARKDRHQAI